MNKNYKTYLIFLGFTSFLWLALQFSKSYEQEVLFDVKYIDHDIEKVIQPESDQNVTLLLEGSGLQLLKFIFFDKTIELSVKEADKLSKKTFYYTGKKLKKALEKSINHKGSIKSIYKDSLFVKYDLLADKELDIKVKSNLKFQPGYQSLKGIELEKAKVKAIGPTEMLAKINSVSTELLTLNALSTDQKGVLSLDSSMLPDKVSLDIEKISYTLEVEKLTEGTFKVPIELINLKENLLIQIFPKEVDVIFKVTLEEFSVIKASDFKVVADFSKKEDKGLLPLRITESPRQAFDVKLEQNEVQFILIK